MTAFDRAWGLTKAFYLAPSSDLAGYHAEYPYSELPYRDRKNVPMKNAKGGANYRVGINLAHPLFRYLDLDRGKSTGREMTEDERIQRIIDTIVHEEGHQAIKEPLYAEAYMDYMRDESPYAYFSHFLPDPSIEEHGAMLVEGIPMSELSETMRRRGKYEYL